MFNSLLLLWQINQSPSLHVALIAQNNAGTVQAGPEPGLTLGSGVRLLIWIGWAGVGMGIGVGLDTWAGLARRVGVAETGVVMTMPVSGVEPVLLQGCPLTMRTW